MSNLISSKAAELSVADLMNISSLIPGSLGSFSKFYKAVGPEMPSDLRPTPAKSSIPAAPVFYYNYDEGHAGRFSVPSTNGASLSHTWVMDQPTPPVFILNNLTFSSPSGKVVSVPNLEDPDAQPVDPEPPTEEDVEEPTNQNDDVLADHTDHSDAVRAIPDDAEVTVFIPGLNTVHQPREGETTTVDRLKHYVSILQSVPMAQIHIGTSFDQGDLRVIHTSSILFKSLFSLRFLPGSLKAMIEGDSMKWDARQLDRLQAALSKYSIIDTPCKQAVRQLLTLSSTSDKSIVLVAYSRGSIEIEAALREYIGEQTETGRDESEVTDELSKITVVTVGSATANYPDGPAYIHIAAWDDPLAKSSGVFPEQGTAGRNAIFLNCTTPYHAESFDNHNFGALTAQYVALVLAASKASGFRDLWERAQRGEMVIPEDADLLTRAMIQLTRGYDWLWTPEKAWLDVPYGALPEPEEAEAVLRERMGDEFVEKLRINFPAK